MSIWLYVAAVLAALSCFLTVVSTRRLPPDILGSFQEFGGRVSRSVGRGRTGIKGTAGRVVKSNWYYRFDRWLVAKGAGYHFWKDINPAGMLLLELLCGGLPALVLGMSYPLLALPVATAGFFGPLLMVRYLNNRDNEELLEEIRLVYRALEIQIRAGMYLTDALGESYASVHNKRFRDALMSLAGDIALKADIYDALNKLNSKFDNRYIDSLCLTIVQALESGQAVELLGDIGDTLKDMEDTLAEHRKSALDRKITLYQLVILGASLGLIIYACVTQMMTTDLFW